MTKPNEPTLTCSEVVERLARCVVPLFRSCTCHLHKEDAEAILHSWRERRVQELEEALRGIMASATPTQKEHPTMFAAWKKAEKTLNSEWREQVRKGAKYE